MRLYHVPQTRSTRVLWLLEEAGAPYELSLLDREGRKTPEHLARHPLGRVPVVEEEGGYLFESAALCLHIADLHPEAGLIPPPGSHERALVYQWVFFSMTELETALLKLLPLRDVDGEKLEAATEDFTAAVRVIETALDGQDYLVGGAFTVADVVCSAVLMFANRYELLGGMPRIAAYLERMEARPARQRATAPQS